MSHLDIENLARYRSYTSHRSSSWDRTAKLWDLQTNKEKDRDAAKEA